MVVRLEKSSKIKLFNCKHENFFCVFFYLCIKLFLSFQLFGKEGSTQYYDTADETSCNWLMFVRPAVQWEEQNLVAYQYRGGIYFTTIKVSIQFPRC